MKKLLLLFFVAISLYGHAQKIKLTQGDASLLKGQTSLNFEFSYEGVRVGKFASEKDYIAKKKADYNAKEPGKGETWEKGWFSDRAGLFEPRFIESFADGGFTSKPDAQYTLIFNTVFIEPGFNVGVMRKPAFIDGVAVLVATSDKSKVLAKYTVDNAPGRDAMGFDYDTGGRIKECYATAGKRLGRFIAKGLGK